MSVSRYSNHANFRSSCVHLLLHFSCELLPSPPPLYTRSDQKVAYTLSTVSKITLLRVRSSFLFEVPLVLRKLVELFVGDLSIRAWTVPTTRGQVC